jgi:phage baseplate assembly protein W
MAARFIASPFGAGPPLARAGAAPRREGIDEVTDPERHVHDRIMAVLFTRPGERLMRPRFGVGLDAQVFESISPLALSAIEYRIRESLAASFVDELLLEDVTVEPGDSPGTILIGIDYALRRDRLPRRLEVVA